MPRTALSYRHARTPCCTSLGPLWAERLGTSTLTARQLSRRGGVLRLDVRGERVVLAGQAVTIVRGEVAPSAGLVLQGP